MTEMNKKMIITAGVLAILAILSVIFSIGFPKEKAPVTTTQEATSTEDKSDKIVVDSPRPSEKVSSPIKISGKARGNWFFEASFPVFVVDWDGKIIGQGVAHANGDWMTTEFVPFEAEVSYTIEPNIYSKKGSLILKKDNPSDLPQNDDALKTPIMFQ